MKKNLLILGCVILSCVCNAQKNLIDIISNFEDDDITQMELPFLYKELIDIVNTDTAFVYNRFIHSRQSSEITPVDLYVNDVCSNALVDSLHKIANPSNIKSINKLVSLLDIHSPTKPNVMWGRVFETCDECPFGDMPIDMKWNVKFSLIYMSQAEIEQMIKYDNGEQWDYLLSGIIAGDYFVGVVTNDPIHREIDRRIIKFLIDKWSPCQIPEVQDLVRVLKKVLPQEYKKAWYDAISGTWKGKFGDRVIELTIKANEWTIKGFSKFEGQPDSKRVEFYGEDSYSQITGPFVTFTMNELPADKEWNGEFFCRLVRNTDKLEGTWRSNNKKLEREFVLEKVK